MNHCNYKASCVHFETTPKALYIYLPSWKHLLVTITCTIIAFSSGAQAVLPLVIGDKMPSTTIGRYMNNPSKKLKTDELNASLVLLDFWSITCGSCIRSIPELEALQKQFKGKVRILTITRDNPDLIKSTLKKRQLPVSTENIILADPEFLKLFPYNSVPHHIWLDKQLRIRHITLGSNATAENFTAFLDNQNLDFAKKYEFEKFDLKQPLWLEGGGRLRSHLQYSSYIMEYIEGYNSSMGQVWDSLKNKAGIKIYNYPLLSIIKLAWGKLLENKFENPNRLSLEIKDTYRLTPPQEKNQYREWYTQNAYSYEITLPFSQKDKMYDFMQQDILRFFSYNIRVEKRKTPCYVLIRTSNIDKLKSAGVYDKQRRSANDSIVLKNYPLNTFVNSLNNSYYQWPKPVIDETEYSGNVDLLLGCWYNEIEKIKIELLKYDLALVEEERWIDILVIRDKKEGSQ